MATLGRQRAYGNAREAETSRMGGWAVTDNVRSRRFGIAANDLKSLLSKAHSRFELRGDWTSYRLYEAEKALWIDDDEALKSIPNQTLLVIVSSDDEIRSEIKHKLITRTKHPKLEINNRILEFFNTYPQEYQSLLEKIDIVSEKTKLQKYEDHAEWFDGIQPICKTKEEHMRKSAQRRIKGYYYKIRNHIKNSDEYTRVKNNKQRKKLDDFLDKLNIELKNHQYHNYYFDRESNCDTFCDSIGTFECQGAWNRERCEKKHLINPYSSKDARILFSTWNLDHNIELSRSIAKSIIKASVTPGTCYKCNVDIIDSLISVKDYYQLIFTRSNLKLVNIVCHDKKQHQPFDTMYIICKKCYQTPN